MSVPTLKESAKYTGKAEDDDKFILEYESLKEWFEEEFSHVSGENNQLKLAFLKNLDHNMSGLVGIKSMKDIDASVTYFDKNSISKPWVKVYEKYKYVEKNNNSFVCVMTS